MVTESYPEKHSTHKIKLVHGCIRMLPNKIHLCFIIKIENLVYSHISMDLATLVTSRCFTFSFQRVYYQPDSVFDAYHIKIWVSDTTFKRNETEKQ